MSRSHLMARSKEELKNELLRNFNKKTIKTSQKKQKQSSSIKSEDNQNRHYQVQIGDQYKGSISYYNKNRNVLDQFTKFPVLDQDEECLYNGEMFLNNFMFKKDRLAFQKHQKIPISVEARKEKKLQEKTKHPKSEFQTKTVSVTISPPIKQYPQVTNFQYRTNPSIKAQNEVLKTKSGFQKVQNKAQLNNSIKNKGKFDEVDSSLDSAEQLLKEMNKGEKSYKSQASFNSLESFEESLQIKKVSSEEQSAKQSKKFKETQSNAKDLQNKQKSKKQNLKDKSLQKSLEENKGNFQKDNKSPYQIKEKSLPEIDHSVGKWIKQKKQQSQPQISIKRETQTPIKRENENKRKQKNEQKIKESIEQDPFDWLAPYESSQSALQAVIQQQNQSELSQSVKSKIEMHNINKQKNWNDQYKKIVLRRDEPKNGKSQIIKEQSEPSKKSQKNQQLKVEKSSEKYLKAEEQKSEKTLIKSQPKQKIEKMSNKEQKFESLEEISLEDLQDLSEVQSNNQNKSSIHNSNKKQIESDELSELPDYVDSQTQDYPVPQKKSKQIIKFQEIPQVINKSEDRAFQESSILSDDGQKMVEKKQNKKEKKKENESESKRGSEGPDNKMNSMLDFFDQVNDKIDFGEISHNLIDIKNGGNDSFIN